MAKLGRKGKYDTHVKPYLENIKEWYGEMDEKQIAERLGISIASWENYKNAYGELREALKNGRQELVSELKSALKKKAKGFYYEETKTSIREENGKQIKVVEKFKKYAQPDTGAIHLLLKNLDETWRNDDQATLELKKKQMELTERRIEQGEYM